MSYIIKCDRCGTTGGPGRAEHIPQGWKSIGISTSVTVGSRYMWHQFCPECVEHLAIHSKPSEETSAEQLVAILESMVDEAMEARDA